MILTFSFDKSPDAVQQSFSQIDNPNPEPPVAEERDSSK